MATYKKRVAVDGDTTWHTIIDAGADPETGTRRQKRLTAPTKDELNRLVIKTLAQVHEGVYVDASNDLVTTYLRHWLDAVGGDVRPTTARTYGIAIERHIVPTLGGVKLHQLTPLHIQRWIAKEQAGGASPTSAGLYLTVLKKALGQAVKWRMLARNPADGVSAPRLARREKATWTTEEARDFLDATAGDDLAALWRLGLTLGPRIGEQLALTWADVSLERATLTIRRTLTRTRDGKLAVGEPKSGAGRRLLALPPSCVAALKHHRARQAERRLQAGELWQDTAVVFDNGLGGWIHPSSIALRFAAAVKQAGVPRLTPHGMRHTAATLALAAGEHPRVVQQRLGHSSITMTLGTYGHVTAAMEVTATDRLERLFG